MTRKRTFTIATLLVALAIFMTPGNFHFTQRAEANDAEPAPVASTYELPLRADDLAVGERFRTAAHGSDEHQGEGHDIVVRRHISDNNWTSLIAEGANEKIVANYLAYGKPFYAMAPGVVVSCWRNAPENIPPDWLQEVRDVKIPLGGNHLWIKQDDGVFVLYAHAKPGTIPTSLCPHNDKLMPDSSLIGSSPSLRKWAAVTNGAYVTPGRFLGRIGNSGQSSAPHLHIHMEKNDTPVVMKFAHGMTIPFSNETASFDGPWSKLAGSDLPKANILFWPRHSVGPWTFKGTPNHEFQALVDHMDDSGEMPDWVSCDSDGKFYNSKWIPKKGMWVMRFAMTNFEAIGFQASFTSQGYKRTSSYTCGSMSVAVWRKN